MPDVHPLAYVHPNAHLGEGVSVGAFSYIEEGAVVGDRCRLENNVTIKKWTTVGEDNVFAQGAVIGGDPQDRKYGGEQTYLRIGNRNIFREYVTVHRASGEGQSSVVGNDCFLMAYSHLGHNCDVADHVTIANAVGVAGHVRIEELVTIGGMAGIHQYVRLGRVAMVGAYTKITRDVPPFMLVEGADQEIRDINAVGLRRIGVLSDDRLALHKACKLLYKSQLSTSNALEIIRREVRPTPEIAIVLAFEEDRVKGRHGRGLQR